MCTYPLIMSRFGTVEFASAYTAVLGFFLLGCANIAIGVFMSALTESQVIAAVLTFVFLLHFTWWMVFLHSSLRHLCRHAWHLGYWSWQQPSYLYHDQEYSDLSSDRCDRRSGTDYYYVVKSSIFEGGIQKVLDVFNLSGHFDNFTSNIFDIKGIVYFLSVIAVCLFLTTQSILKRRWN